MNKYLFILLFLISGSFLLPADTILLCMSDNYPINDNYSPWIKEVLNAFEDGTMNAAFNSDYIVTNTFLNEYRKISIKDNLSLKDKLSFTKLAKIMGTQIGADYIIFFTVIFPQKANSTSEIPIFKVYSMFDKNGKEIFKEKKSAIDIKNAKNKLAILDKFTSEGEKAAKEMIKFIR